ncbi:MAG: PD-(D/E)XK nuclease family protein [Planctomycetota bacterium]|nr:MAG: PD-(D/E)XK nuclease family protein [Planctomycetota bacterium]
MTTTEQVRRPALSPSRAADFKQCPLRYRLNTIEQIPEPGDPIAVRGNLVHLVLERLFDLPAGERTPAAAGRMLHPTWKAMCEEEPEFAAALGQLDPDMDEDAWLLSAAALLDRYFELEDPTRFTPTDRELQVELELESGTPLRGFIDRVDQAPDGRVRVVDYKTGKSPHPFFEDKVMFQLKFYALALLLTRGVVPAQVKVIYLGDGETLTHRFDEDELRRFSRTLDAIWTAIRKAAQTGDFRPSPSKLCDWCSHHALCPAKGGTPPPWQGWPELEEAIG